MISTYGFGFQSGGSGGGGGGSTNAKYGVATGTNTYAVTITGITSLTEGQVLYIKFANANTGACTLNLNGGGAIAMLVFGTDAMTSGDLKNGQVAELIYDGTNYQVLSVTDNIVVYP